VIEARGVDNFGAQCSFDFQFLSLICFYYFENILLEKLRAVEALIFKMH